jgi:hypothetical protein
MPRFFSHIGLTVGVGYADQDMLADGGPPSGITNTMAWVEAGQPGCNRTEAGAYCVQVATPGFVPTVALRATVGYYLTERFALAATLRYQFNAGESSMANMLIGVRGQFLFTEPVAEGLHLAGFIGTSYGQIQLQVEQPQPPAPYILSGLNGVQLGTVLGYRFSRNLGVVVTPELHILFPTFMIGIDFTAGLEVAF